MAFDPLQLTVLTPEDLILQAEGVTRVQAQLADGGGIGICPGHAPLLAETVAAPLAYVDHAGEHTVDLEAGILEIADGQVTIFVGPDVDRDVAADVSAEGVRFDRLVEALYGMLGGQAEVDHDAR